MKKLNIFSVILLIFIVLLIPEFYCQADISSGYQEYFVPGDEEQLWNLYVDNDNNPALIDILGIHSAVSVTASLRSSTVYYDHWENGYNFDPENPESTYDEKRVLDFGEVAEFESSNVPVNPRGAATYYDGRDRIYTAGGPVSVIRVSWPESIGTVYSLAWELYPVNVMLESYEIPIGEDLATGPQGYHDFTNTYITAQATKNNTNITIDNPLTAGVEINTNLNMGETVVLYDVGVGTVVDADKNVQVQILVGAPWPGGSSEMRGFSVFPDDLWSKEYYNPVPNFSGIDSELYLYNPGDSPMAVTYEDKSGSGNCSVPSNYTFSFTDACGKSLIEDSGVYLKADRQFWVLGSIDSGNMAYDWGFTLIPDYALSDEYYLGWAPGTSEPVPTSNGSPIYITPVRDNTRIYIDYSPTDNVVDVIYTADRFESIKVFDPDNENTGMHIWSTGPMAILWGEDPDTATSGNPYLDVGYTTLPILAEWLDPVFDLDKSIDNEFDAFNPAGATAFKLVAKTFNYPVYDVVVKDYLPYGWVYVPNSSSIIYPDGSMVTGSAADPLVSGLELTWNVGIDMGTYETLVIKFSAASTDDAIVGYNQNNSEATATRHEGDQIFSPIAREFVYVFPYNRSSVEEKPKKDSNKNDDDNDDDDDDDDNNDNSSNYSSGVILPVTGGVKKNN